MILSALPVGAFGQTDDVQTDVRNDVFTQATSAFGGMLTDAIDTQDIDADSPYFISDLIFDGNKATASYYNEAACTLVVAVYDEETEQMIDSAVTSVETESLEATVSFSSLPENFVAKAFLLDENNAWLCKPYTCNENTTAYKEFIGKTVQDFDEDRVINLDESLTNNFVVLTDDTIIVNGNNETNVLESADVENDEYIFSNIDEQIKNLRVGDMFYLDNGDEENITVIKIASISVEGNKAVIIADNTTLAEAFEYVKINTEADAEDMVYDGSEADEGVTYLGDVDYETGEPITPDDSEIETQAVDIGGKSSVAKKFTHTEDNMKADLLIKVEVNTKVFISKEYGEVSLTVDPTINVTVTVENKIPLKEVSLGKFVTISPIPGVFIDIMPSFIVEFSGKMTVSGELTFTLGVAWKSGSGFVNKCKKPSFKPEIKAQATLFIGFDLKPELTVLHEHVASASMSGTAGAEIEAIRTTDKGENHSCTVCTDGNIQGKLEIKAELTIAKTTPIGGEWEATLVEITFKIADFYYSETNNKFGWGECPFKNDGSGGETGGSGGGGAPEGYHFSGGYDEDGNPIYHAIYYIAYAVNIYMMDGNGEYGEPADCYIFFNECCDSDYVTYVPDIPDGYWLNTEKSVLEATVSYDGSTVLSVYLDCSTYDNGGSGDIPSRPGYKFIGYDDETGEPIWVVLAYTISFNATGGYFQSTGEREKIFYATYGDLLMQPEEIPVKPGYIFDGWTLSGNEETEEFPILVQTNDLYYEARWKLNMSSCNTGDKVYFGSYPQSQKSDGTYEVEPIEWRVLENKNGELLLLSEKILDVQPYHNIAGVDTTWAECSLRTWLNNNFYNTAFNENEQELISTTNLVNGNNPFSGVSGGKNTQDRIYLLSYSDCLNADYGFSTSAGSSDTRLPVPSKYAEDKDPGASNWWLRTPGKYGSSACHVYTSGSIGSDGYYVLSPIGIRPALRINLNSASASDSLETQSVSYTLDNGVDTLGFSYDKCIAGNTYTLLNVTDYGEGFELSSDNLYYINTVPADENGAVNTSFIPKANAENSAILLIGDFGNGTETVVVEEWYNEYTITWNTDGETVTQTVIEGAEIIAPETPVKQGYTFTGWTPSIPETMPDCDLTFTATWAVNKYDAVFNANGGMWADDATEKTVSTEYGAEIIAPETPVKQGYIFSKWSPEIGIMDSIDGKIFTAEWIPATNTRYTVETYTMNTVGEYEKTVQTLGGTTGKTVSTNPEIKTGFTLNSEKSVLSGTVAADNSLVLKVFIDRNTYTFVTVIDGVSAETKYYYGSMISEPVSPAKDGYKFMGWDTEIPSTMPAKNVNVTAVFEKSYICPDCGEEILGEDAINAHIATEENAKIKATIKIKNNSGSKTINYGETLRLTAVITDMPADAKIYWYVDGKKAGEGETFEVSPSSGSVEITVKIVDSSGKVLINADGNEVSDSQKVSVNSSFWQKIVSFFKNLFGLNRTVVQLFKAIY